MVRLLEEMSDGEEARARGDVTIAGAWKTTVSLETAYQPVGQDTILKGVSDAGDLREAP